MAAKRLIVAGGGMAGLAAGVRARELGARVVVYEKGDRPGGSMLLSSCVIWRHREWDDFRAECPGGDEALQRLVWERLDDAIAWLESLGAPVLEHETGNRRTIGKRFAPRGLTDMLVRAAGDGCVYRHHGSTDATILATGGFQGSPDLVAEHIDEARETGIEIDNVVDAANTYAVFLWGPERVRVEYVEHKPTFSLT